MVDDVHARKRPHRRIADLAVLRGEHKVAEGDELGGAGETIAVNLRDHRLKQVPDRRVGVNEAARPLSRPLRHISLELRPVLAAGRQVVARAEGPPRAPQYDRAHVVVKLNDPQRVDKLREQRAAERVQLLGTVEGNAAHPPDHLGAQMLVRGVLHAAPPRLGRMPRILGAPRKALNAAERTLSPSQSATPATQGSP